MYVYSINVAGKECNIRTRFLCWGWGQLHCILNPFGFNLKKIRWPRVEQIISEKCKLPILPLFCTLFGIHPHPVINL